MADSDFDKLEAMIEKGTHPFPVTEARRLILRATGRTQASDKLARAIDQLNRTLCALAEMIEEFGDRARFTRDDALYDLMVLRRLCLSH